MNKSLIFFSAIIFSSLLSGTAMASPDDITIEVIDSTSDSVDDVTRHIEVPDSEDHEAVEHSKQDDMDDDKDEQHEDMDDDKDDSKNDMDDDKDDGRDDDTIS
jgi:uncharacterized membrane protein YukC